MGTYRRRVGIALLATAMCVGAKDDAKPVGRLTFQRLATRDRSASVECLDLATGETTVVVKATQERPSIRSFHFLSNGKEFLVEMGAGKDFYVNNEFYLGRVEDGGMRRLTENGVYDGEPRESPDGRQIAFTRGFGVDGRVHVMDRESGEVRALPTPGFALTRTPRWTLGGRILATGYTAEKEKGLVELDPATGTVRTVAHGQFGYVVPSPDRRRFACVVQKRNAVPFPLDSRYTVNILDPATGKLESMNSLFGLGDKDISPVWSPEGEQLAWVRNDLPARTCRLLVYDLGKKRVRALPLPDEEGAGGMAIAWGPDGKWMACVTRDRKRRAHRLSVLSLANGTLRELLSSEQELCCLAWQK